MAHVVDLGSAIVTLLPEIAETVSALGAAVGVTILGRILRMGRRRLVSVLGPNEALEAIRSAHTVDALMPAMAFASRAIARETHETLMQTAARLELEREHVLSLDERYRDVLLAELQSLRTMASNQQNVDLTKLAQMISQDLGERSQASAQLGRLREQMKQLELKLAVETPVRNETAEVNSATSGP